MSSSIIGRTLANNYKVVEILGHGGMATVYIGYQEAVDRQVAIKVLPPHPGMDKQFIDRFQLEAKTIAKLQHPHILPLYDYGMTDDNILFLVMAYIRDGTLADKIDHGALPLISIEKILRDIAGALDYAHRQGVIHRDLKPANILMDAEGHALLADFGIAKISEGGGNLTGTAVVGTPAYMAPEQAQGIEIDSRADIYALGTIVFEMLTGRQPFQAETPMKLLLMVIQKDAPNLLELRDDLPSGLDLVLRRAMAKNPDERYQSAIDFAEDFSQAIHNSDDSLLMARRAMPLGQKHDDTMIPGKDANNAPLGSEDQTQIKSDSPSQTIIVHQQTNPLLLLGGFALIAVVIVVVVLLALNGQADDSNDSPDNDNNVIANTDLTATADAQAVVIVPTELSEPTFGRLSIATFSSLGDTLNLRTENFRSLPNGQIYVAWLVNTSTNDMLPIGEFSVDAIGEGSLSFTDEAGRLLPAYYNAIAISQEEAGAVGEQVTGEILYSGIVPIEITALYFDTFVESEAGINGAGLLESARREATTANQHAGLAANASSVTGVHTHAEHTVNILRGELEDYDGNGRPSNPGAGFGVYVFLDLIEEGLTTALASPYASRNFVINAESLRVCLFNTRERADRIVELELELLDAEEDPSLADGGLSAIQPTAEESTVVSDALVPGVDLNGNGSVEDFEGECGLDQMETFGLLVAQIELTEGGLPESVSQE